MQINITARHLDLTPSLASYVRKKVEKCERFFDHLVWAQVILTVEKRSQIAELIIHARKMTFRSKEESIDLYAAIDLMMDKMEKQLHKHKEIVKVHRKTKSDSTLRTVKESQSEIVSFPESKKYIINEIKHVDVKPSSISEAIDEMELLGYNFYLYLDADTSQINVVYRKDNGSYGLIQPQM